jgi:hypothetical protein
VVYGWELVINVSGSKLIAFLRVTLMDKRKESVTPVQTRSGLVCCAEPNIDIFYVSGNVPKAGICKIISNEY